MTMTTFLVIISLATLSLILTLGVNSLYHNAQYAAKHRVQFAFIRSGLISVVTVLVLAALLYKLMA